MTYLFFQYQSFDIEKKNNKYLKENHIIFLFLRDTKLVFQQFLYDNLGFFFVMFPYEYYIYNIKVFKNNGPQLNNNLHSRKNIKEIYFSILNFSVLNCLYSVKVK